MNTSHEPSDLASSFETAVEEYETQTGIRLVEHPLAKKLGKCDLSSINRVLRDQSRAFRGSHPRLTKSAKLVVHSLHALSTCSALSESIGLVVRRRALIVITGVGILLSVVKGVSGSYDAVVDLFESFESFLTPLDIYAEFPPSLALTTIVEGIMVELLRTLTFATKRVKQGQLKKFQEKLSGEIDVEAVLQRLDVFTEDEARATAGQTLEVVYGLLQMMRAAMDDTKASNDYVREARAMVERFMNKTKCYQLQKDVQKWLSPPDPRKNHNIACEAHHSGTATWFIQGSIFSEWKSSGSLLWVQGKPGSGKTVLCSTIIQDIDRLCKSGLASLAFFYCDFRDDQKQDRRGLISSILVQLCVLSNSYSNILSDFYSAHYHGLRHASDGELLKCLEDILRLPGPSPIYIIVDALDECTKSSGMPSRREKVLALVGELVELALPNLRICVTSRPEADIEARLCRLTFRTVSLHDERSQTRDILDYVTSVVNSDPKIQSWRAEDKERVIKVLYEKADGMFRWASCQLDVLRHCSPDDIHRTLDGLPETLDAMYERTLRDIDEQNWEYAHRMFQCIMVASRPLRVEELAEFLAFDFDAGQIPTFRPDWRPEDPKEAVLSICSSLIAIDEENHSRVIRFTHFSVKEFLTSSRLAMAQHRISRRYHVLLAPAHTTVAQACLSILLRLDNGFSNFKDFPLAHYAARHWVDHAQIENVSSKVQDGMKDLFDPRKRHFSVWAGIYDPDAGRIQRSNSPSQPRGSPLRYAALYGFRDVAGFLVIELLQDVNKRSGPRNQTPLSVACGKGYLEVTRLLLEHGANPNTRDEGHSAPLHMASQRGDVEVVRILLEHDADVNAQSIGNSTPLHEASQAGHTEIALLLLEYGAAVDCRDQSNSTPLHEASRGGDLGTTRVLLDYGADTNATTMNSSTPLHWASQEGHFEVARVLVEHGGDINCRGPYNETPLHLASQGGHLEIVRFLMVHGADPNSQGNNSETPLHQASRGGHLEVARFLLERDASVNSRSFYNETALYLATQEGHLEVARILLEYDANPNYLSNNETPLHRALRGGHLEIALILLEHRADPHSRSSYDETPLHLASQGGYLDVVRALLERGADPNSRSSHETPLHLALRGEHLEVARILLEHHASANSRDSDNQTPLHRALRRRNLEVARVLLQYGADPNSQDSDSQIPLHRALREGHREVALMLLQHGARPNSRDSHSQTPLHRALREGNLEVSRVLLQHGADPNSQDSDNQIPLHRALREGHWEVALVLLQYGARHDSRDSESQTPLHLASQSGHLEVARVLLQHGAEVHAQGVGNQTSLHRVRHNWTPLHFASFEGRLEVVRILLEHGADPNAGDARRESSLRLALQRRCLGIFVWGADRSSLDDPNFTPLHLASQSGKLEVAQVLLEHGGDIKVRDSRNRTPLDNASNMEMRNLLVSSETTQTHMRRGVVTGTGLCLLWCH